MSLNPADPAFVALLRERLPDRAVRPVDESYLSERRGLFHGQAGAIVTPFDTAQVATVVRAAGQARVAVVPYGGGTGLVGGQVAPDGPLPLILSLENMNSVRKIHAQEKVMIAEAGAILHDVREAAAGQDLLFPLALAAEGSCRIGGNLATNAGGINVLRYGNARDLCLGLEAVLPDGSVWTGLKRLRKDNTGYDLKDLLIGSEGTLGVITAASLRLFARPTAHAAALISVPDPGAAVSLLGMAQVLAGDAISAFELISGVGLRFLAETMPDIRQPFATPPEWMVLIDLGMFGDVDAQDLLTRLFVAAEKAGLASDGLIAQNEAQRDQLFTVRESIPDANRRIGAIASHDISLPITAIEGFVTQATQALAGLGDFRINCFGHLGDGNLHFNVFPPAGVVKADLAHLGPDVRRVVHDLVDRADGSFSAEHGVGRLKVDDLERYGDPARLAAMRTIKQALDPLGIMNPGAVLRRREK